MTVRERLEGPAGRVAAVVVVLLGGALLWYQLGGNQTSASAQSRGRWFVDAETNIPFKATLEDGMTIPIRAPSGKDTGYEAELCYWTADGHVKSDPTPVLLNGVRKLPGPTFCPDCGRLVVSQNPYPREGVKPPPTQAEFQARMMRH